MDTNEPKQSPRLAWVTGTFTAGGIGPVCRYAAEGVAKAAGWRTTVVSLHDKADTWTDATTGVHYVALGLTANAPQEFLRWLEANPHDIVITNDVSRIEASFPFFPKGLIHVVNIHNSAKRARDVALRNQRFVDGVVCVGNYFEAGLRRDLERGGFNGVLGTVHNGASFPPLPTRTEHSGPLRLLFTSRLEPLSKGTFDLVPILDRLARKLVPVRLVVAGGRDETLESRFKRGRLEHLVNWVGQVPHEECYKLAVESDVFLMLSRREPFGMVTIEAMSMGCVPLAYDIPSGSREIIENGKSGLLLPLGDFDAWARAIQTLHEDRRRWSDFSREATLRARTQFSSEKLGERFVTFLKQVKSHSLVHASERRLGLPVRSETTGPKMAYYKLPAWFREWVRNVIGVHPRISWWLLNR